jgi:DNA-binding protein HU-beta
MNKAELIEALAKKLSVPKTEAKRFLETFLEILSSTLKKGFSIALLGFGSFLIKKRKARKGYNPQTGETLKIPATKVVAFKVGSKLKALVSGKKKK